jgi:acyl carrier protein
MTALTKNLTGSLTEIAVRYFLLNYFSTTIAAIGLKAEDLDDDFDLLKAGVVDSLGVIEMISAVEQHFKIIVDFERLDPEEIAVLGAFSRFVAENASSKALRVVDFPETPITTT